MIVDFNYPNLAADGWKVKVVKTTNTGKLYVQTMRFEDKDDAFEYYEHMKLLWRYQQTRKTISELQNDKAKEKTK